MANNIIDRLRILTKDLSAYGRQGVVLPKNIKLRVTVIYPTHSMYSSILHKKYTVDIIYDYKEITVRDKAQVVKYVYQKRYDNALFDLKNSIRNSFVEYFTYDGHTDFDVSCVYTDNVDESIGVVRVIFVYDSGEYAQF